MYKRTGNPEREMKENQDMLIEIKYLAGVWRQQS